jgi:hypothetical protein
MFLKQQVVTNYKGLISEFFEIDSKGNVTVKPGQEKLKYHLTILLSTNKEMFSYGVV